MPQSGWAREPWRLSLRVQSLCSATGEATTVTGLRTAKKKKSRDTCTSVEGPGSDGDSEDIDDSQHILHTY